MKRLAKPVLDRTVAAIAIVVSFPAMVLIAIAIRAAMGRSVCFVDRRPGQNARITLNVYDSKP